MGRKARILLPEGASAGMKLLANIPVRFDPVARIAATVVPSAAAKVHPCGEFLMKIPCC